MRDQFGKRQKPLFVMRHPSRAKGYRSRVKPFQATRFLDASKIAKRRKQSLEIGILGALKRPPALPPTVLPGIARPLLAQIL
jgi:hypothetical protein